MHPVLRRLSSLTLAAGVALAGASPALAADEVNASPGLTAAGAPLALHGFDPVAYFTLGRPTPGSAEHAAVHEGATYYFASEANLDAFEKQPERYAPAFGGFCSYGVAAGKKFDGDPRFWKVVNDRLYLNLNADVARRFEKDVAGSITKAEQQWLAIEHAPIGEL